jgi:hypothetical protein
MAVRVVGCRGHDQQLGGFDRVAGDDDDARGLLLLDVAMAVAAEVADAACAPRSRLMRKAMLCGRMSAPAASALGT